MVKASQSPIKFDHDLFVSYARVDDRLVSGVEKGWVTTLMNDLDVRLSMIFGRHEGFSVWWDQELRGNDDVTPEITAQLESSATLLVILSPGYLASTWCMQERIVFLSVLRKRGHDRRGIFVVHREPVERKDVPEGLEDKTGYKFWVERDGVPRTLAFPRPNPDVDRAYYDKVDDIARDIYTEVMRIRSKPGTQVAIQTAFGAVPPGSADQTGVAIRADSGANTEATAEVPQAEHQERVETVPVSKVTEARVYLAETTDELDVLRDEVVRYLDQFGYGVLPNTWYSRKGNEFEAALKEDLERCLLFVQLLGGHAGKRLEGLAESFVQTQYRCAAAAGKPILQWRQPSLDLEAMLRKDAVHSRLLQASTVQAVDLESFKKAVVALAGRERDRLKSKERDPAEDAISAGALVFVDSDPSDLEKAEVVSKALSDRGCVSFLPRMSGTPEEVRRDREDRLLECEGVVVVYGLTPLSWVRQQFTEIVRIIHRRRANPIRAVAVAEFPPDPKEPIQVRMRGMHLLDCRQGVHADQLGRFVGSLVGA